jgi:hypothetical protein
VVNCIVAPFAFSLSIRNKPPSNKREERLPRTTEIENNSLASNAVNMPRELLMARALDVTRGIFKLHFGPAFQLLAAMRPVRALLLYLITVFVIGALLAPWLYWGAQSAAAHLPALSKIAANPFHRFVHRAMLGLALICLWPLLRSLGKNSWKDLGLGSDRAAGPRIWGGFAIGFGSLALVAILALATSARKLNLDLGPAEFWKGLATASISAVIVALLEEILFRGALLGAFRKAWDWRVALLASSAIYAIVHFFQRPPSPAHIEWYSGLAVLGGMLHGFVEWNTLVPGFLTLTVAGFILGLAFLNSGRLYFSIGIHAGWIFWLKFYALLTVPQNNSAPWLWGTARLFDGWLALIILLPICALFWRNASRSRES